MLNRSPSESCPLCKVWGIAWNPKDKSTWHKQHIHAEALWQKWNPEKKGWTRDVVDELSRLDIGLSCSEEEARDHYRHHRPEQPQLSGYIERERAIAEALALSPLEQQIIVTIYRQRFLSTQQVQELFFAGKMSDRSAKQKTSSTLTRLARSHLLYRYFPSSELAARRGAPEHFAKQALWFLGKKAVPFAEEEMKIKVGPRHYIQMAKQVDENIVIHDLRLNQLYVSLHRQIREQENIVELPDGRIAPAWLNTDNWYSDRHLAFGFYDRLTQQSKEVAADAFATISLSRPSYSVGDIPACQLPFFLEYDRGSKTQTDVAAQLLNYHLLAISGAAARRFTQLNARNYSVPVIMVFSDSQRMLSIQDNFHQQAAKLGLSQGAPIFLTSEEEWNRSPLAKKLLISAWHSPDQRFYLIDLLLKSSERLIKEKIILPSKPLVIDHQGARRTSGGGTRAATLRGGREKLKEKRQALLDSDKEGIGGILEKASQRRSEALRKRSPAEEEGRGDMQERLEEKRRARADAARSIVDKQER